MARHDRLHGSARGLGEDRATRIGGHPAPRVAPAPRAPVYQSCHDRDMRRGSRRSGAFRSHTRGGTLHRARVAR
jgi:hypothetical protein